MKYSNCKVFWSRSVVKNSNLPFRVLSNLTFKKKSWPEIEKSMTDITFRKRIILPQMINENLKKPFIATSTLFCLFSLMQKCSFNLQKLS